MKLRQLLVFLLILALAGCSEEPPKPEKKTAGSAPPTISAPAPPIPEQQPTQHAAPAAQAAPQVEKEESTQSSGAVSQPAPQQEQTGSPDAAPKQQQHAAPAAQAASQAEKEESTQTSGAVSQPEPQQKQTGAPDAAPKQDAAPAGQAAPPAEKKEGKPEAPAEHSSSKQLFDPFDGIVSGIAQGLQTDSSLEMDSNYDSGTTMGGSVVIDNAAGKDVTQGINVVKGEVAVVATQGAVIGGSVKMISNSTPGNTVQGINVVAAEPAVSYASAPMPSITPPSPPPQDGETYNKAKESGFLSPLAKPLSTFSIDVDTASYSNVRRLINEGQRPPAGAVRIEELINYFSYAYPQPGGEHPFSVTTELGPCPWSSSHKLVRIGLKARDIDKKELPPSNLVFLIDVSGSMADANKLPLLKQGLNMLVRQLSGKDRVAMVVYAGSEYVALEPTPGSEQGKILAAINALGAGGSTHASSGIVTAYQLAEQSFISGGNNRVILASDGDFNVGVTSPEALQKLIEEKRKTGVHLTVLGFGMGNYRDDTMEVLADKGNGSYAYIDSLLEAKKVLVKEMSGTLFTVAKDVKIQVEFNPAKISAYRLLGYENRALADEDFNNDKKDAGEIGAGHTVTALYELIPVGAQPLVDPLKYQKPEQKPLPAEGAASSELMTVKLRYKPLNSDKSVLLDTVVADSETALAQTSADFRFAAAVAGYGMLLTGSELAGGLTWPQVIQLAKEARGSDEEGYRAEFVRLAESAELLSK